MSSVFSDNIQQKVLKAFDDFITQSIIGDDCFVTKDGTDLFTSDNIDKCYTLFEKAAPLKPKGKKNNSSAIVVFANTLRGKVEYHNNEELTNAIEQDKTEQSILQVFADINWLYTMPDRKDGKIEALNKLYVEDKYQEKFFVDGVTSYGQSTSQAKKDSLLMFMQILKKIKDEKQWEECTSGKDPVQTVKNSIIDILNNSNDDSNTNTQESDNNTSTQGSDNSSTLNISNHGKYILEYLCAPVRQINKADDYTGLHFPIVAEGDRKSIEEKLKVNENNDLRAIARDLYEKLNPQNTNNQTEQQNQTDTAKPTEIPSQAGSGQQKAEAEEKIRKKMNREIDWKNPFYSPYISPFWKKDGVTEFTEGNALKYKHAVILYGPPGTSKTYHAKQLAAMALRGDMNFEDYIKDPVSAEIEIANRIHRLQLHANYTYEDFIWGYQIENNGQSKAKKGYFLRLLDEMNNNQGMPHVLILDEINRVDISRIFGELFSAVENRGEKVDLQQEVEGTKSVAVPENLYIIGTMNEIDFSLERVDFALRRRFLWYFYGFKEDKLRDIIHDKWPLEKYSQYVKDIEPYIAACKALNDKISAHPQLGEQYQIGHTFFAEIVDIMKQLSEETKRFDKAKQILWDISIKPILEAYMGNMDKETVKSLLEPSENKKQDSFKYSFFGEGNTDDDVDNGEE